MKTTFKIIEGNFYEYDSNGNLIHYKNSNGYETWYEYDSHGNLTHYRNSNGGEFWRDSNGKKITKKQFDKLNSSCDGKVVEIDGKKYQLTLI